MFKDRPEDGENLIQHTYVGRYAGLGVDLVSYGLWEGYGSTLVDPETGAMAEVAEPPIPSPGGRTFASASADEGYNFHGVEVVERTPGGFRKSAEIGVSYPCDLRWLSDDRLSVRVRRGAGDGAVWEEAFVVREGAAWRYVPPTASRTTRLRPGS